MNRPRLFLSAVSEELRTARQAVAATVRTLGFDPVSQDDFPSGHGELRQWLREQLDSCEGLIQLVGEGYGAEPPEVDQEYGRVSYTQFEFLHARHQSKKTWVVVIGQDFGRDKPPDQLDLPHDPSCPDHAGYQAERRILQQAYLARLKRENHLRHTANNKDQLELIVLRLRDELGELRRQWDEWLRKDAGFKAHAAGRLDEIAEASRLTTEKIRVHLLQTAEETHRRELAEAETDIDWRRRQHLREAAENAHIMRLSSIDEWAVSYAEIHGRGTGTSVFQEMRRILAEQGVDEAITYVGTQRSSIFQTVRARAASARDRNRADLQPLLRTAALHQSKGRTIEAQAIYTDILAIEPDWPEALQRASWWLQMLQKGGLIGDLLIIAEEAPIGGFRAMALIMAAESLRRKNHFDLALEKFEQSLAIEPDNLKGLRGQGICLQRLVLAGGSGHSWDRARAHYRKVLERHSEDQETWVLLGRVEKNAWITAWHQAGKTPAQWREEAAEENALLKAAIDTLAKGYSLNPSEYYIGIDVLTLMHLYRHLTNDARYNREMETMSGAVRFAAECEPDEQQWFWSKATLGDLEVLIGTPETTKAAYKEAIAKNDKDWFALKSSCAQLQLLKDLDFRPDTVGAGLATFDRALQKLEKPDDGWRSRQVFLFSGHMIDAPERPTPRFPADKESIAAQKISDALQQLGAGPEDLALTQGACGGDLLFTEACQHRKVIVQWLQPFDEPEFIQKSVICRGEDWRNRYLAAKAKLTRGIRSAPEQLGPPPKGVDPFERCNLWLLYTALAYGVEKVHFICLWDGGGGDGKGGTAHMYAEVKRRSGNVRWIDTRTL